MKHEIVGIKGQMGYLYETEDFHDTPVQRLIDDSLREAHWKPIRPFTEGEQIGMYPGAKSATLEPPTAVLRALRFLSVVQSRNAEIVRWKSEAKMLVLDVEQQRLIDDWRKAHGLWPV